MWAASLALATQRAASGGRGCSVRGAETSAKSANSADELVEWFGGWLHVASGKWYPPGTDPPAAAPAEGSPPPAGSDAVPLGDALAPRGRSPMLLVGAAVGVGMVVALAAIRRARG